MPIALDLTETNRANMSQGPAVDWNRFGGTCATSLVVDPAEWYTDGTTRI